jgi:hypothetical protein
MPTIEELRGEHDELGVGPLIDATFRSITAEVVRGYPPAVYAHAPAWTEDTIDDLLQDVYHEWLIGQGQLAYILGAARTTSEFRALATKVLRRALGRRRVRTVIDNLLDRCRVVLREEPFETTEAFGRQVYRRRGSPPYEGDASDHQIRDAQLRVMTIPRLPDSSGDRASPIYTTANLRVALQAVAASIPGGFTMADLDRILRQVLTPWVASFLIGEQEEAARAAVSTQLTPEDIMLANDATTRVLSSLSADEKSLLRLYLANANDSEIADALGLRARQTIIKRRANVAKVLADHLDELPVRVADTVVSRLAVALAASGGEADA